MRSHGRPRILQALCPYKKRKSRHRSTAEGRPSGDTGRRQPCINQGGRPQERSAPTSDRQPPTSRTAGKYISAVSATTSGRCHGSPRSPVRVMHRGTWRRRSGREQKRLKGNLIKSFTWHSISPSHFSGTSLSRVFVSVELCWF